MGKRGIFNGSVMGYVWYESPTYPIDVWYNWIVMVDDRIWSMWKFLGIKPFIINTSKIMSNITHICFIYNMITKRIHGCLDTDSWEFSNWKPICSYQSPGGTLSRLSHCTQWLVRCVAVVLPLCFHTDGQVISRMKPPWIVIFWSSWEQNCFNPEIWDIMGLNQI